MSGLLVFAGQHPWLFAFLAYLLRELILYLLKFVNRIIRHLNIRKAGWPPQYLDADGDLKREPK